MAKKQNGGKWEPRTEDLADFSAAPDVLVRFKAHIEASLASLGRRVQALAQRALKSTPHVSAQHLAAYFALRDAAATFLGVLKLVDQAIARTPLEADDLVYVSTCVVSSLIDARDLNPADRRELDRHLENCQMVLNWTVHSLEKSGIDAGHLRAVAIGSRTPETLACAMSGLQCVRNRTRRTTMVPVQVPQGGGFKPITSEHEMLLERLNRTPTRCRTVSRLAIEGPVRNRHTVGKLLRQLLAIGLVYQPYSNKKGYAITPEGSARLKLARS